MQNVGTHGEKNAIKFISLIHQAQRQDSTVTKIIISLYAYVALTSEMCCVASHGKHGQYQFVSALYLTLISNRREDKGDRYLASP